MDPLPPRPFDAGWLHQLGSRLCTMWLAKLVGTTLGMTAFFVAYIVVLKHPLFPVFTVPLTGVDRWVAFQPAALPLYLSLWVYVSLAPGLLINRRELESYGLAAIVLSMAGLGIFVFWPTAVPLSQIEWSQHPSFAFLKSIDATGNACPSLHVAFAVFTAIWIERVLREMRAGGFFRAVNWLWCLGILYSTMAIRQHVALDVLAGAGLAAIVATVHLRWLRPPA